MAVQIYKINPLLRKIDIKGSGLNYWDCASDIFNCPWKKLLYFECSSPEQSIESQLLAADKLTTDLTILLMWSDAAAFIRNAAIVIKKLATSSNRTSYTGPCITKNEGVPFRVGGKDMFPARSVLCGIKCISLAFIVRKLFTPLAKHHLDIFSVVKLAKISRWNLIKYCMGTGTVSAISPNLGRVCYILMVFTAFFSGVYLTISIKGSILTRAGSSFRWGAE